METKLTLSIDKKVIEKAKQYARSKQVSLSKLIEAHLLSVTSEKEENLYPGFIFLSRLKILSNFEHRLTILDL